MVLPCGVCICFKYYIFGLMRLNEAENLAAGNMFEAKQILHLALYIYYLLSWIVIRLTVRVLLHIGKQHWYWGMVWFAHALKLIFWKWLICFFLMHGSLFDFQAFHTFALCTETKDNVWMPLQSKCIHSLFGSCCWAVGIIMHSRFHFGWLLFP